MEVVKSSPASSFPPSPPSSCGSHSPSPLQVPREPMNSPSPLQAPRELANSPSPLQVAKDSTNSPSPIQVQREPVPNSPSPLQVQREPLPLVNSPSPVQVHREPLPLLNKDLPKTILPFSIENILRPDFGPSEKRPSPPLFSPLSRELILRTPPKTPDLNRVSDSPVDLSHKKHFISSFLPSVSNPVTALSGLSKILNQSSRFLNQSSRHLNQSSNPLSQSSRHLNQSLDSLSQSSRHLNQSLDSLSQSSRHLNQSSNSLSQSSNSPNQSSTTKPQNSPRTPETPEELANPKVPDEDVVWPAWVYCTRYSDRPSSGPRSRRIKRQERTTDEKRPRTAFTSDQLARLKVEFDTNKYLTEKRRQDLARELGLNESQIKIWFQNKRAKIKKTTGSKSGLAQQLIAQGLYNHSTMALDEDDPYLM